VARPPFSHSRDLDALKIVEELPKEDEKTYPIPAIYFKNTVSQRKLNTKL